MIHEPTTKASDTQRRPLPPSMVARKASGPESSGASALRQRVGNQAIQRLLGERAGSSNSSGQAPLRSPAIQAKLTISQPGDVHEQEADRVADAVMRIRSPEMGRMPTVSSVASIPKMQRLCAECDDDLSMKAQGVEVYRREQAAVAPLVNPSTAANIRALRGSGSALSTSVRAFFEPRFGADFRNVRVHTGTRAEEAAQSIGASAFTVGHDIGFASGQYSPESGEGRKLLAHELTHVVQQDALRLPQIQRDVPKTPTQGSTSKGTGGGPDPMSDDIKKLGPDGIPHAANRVSDAADRVYESAANGLKVFLETEQFKDVEHTWWDKELVIAIASLALGGFFSKLMSISFGTGQVKDALGNAWGKGIEAAVTESAKREFTDTLPEKTYPIVAFAQGQRQILLDLKSQSRDNFDNKTAPSLHLKAVKDPSLVPGILAEFQQMLVNFDNAAKTAGAEQFRQTLDAWNVYMAKSALIPAKDKRAKSETPLAEVVNGGAALLDFPPGVLRIECRAERGLKEFRGWRFEIRGLNESLRSSFRGRSVADVRVPQVALIHITEPASSFVIGRNEAGGFFLNAGSDTRWALYELAVPNWRQLARDVREGTARPRPMERDVWEGARIIIEQSIGPQHINEVKRIDD